jgi:hypothetical protein
LGSLETCTCAEDADRFVFRAVHAASVVDCPRPVVKIATIVHPTQMQEKDVNGMTPLLISAQAPIFKVRDLSDEGYMLEDRIHGDDNIYNETQNDDEQDSSKASVIEILVQADGFSACITDSQGRLPLHLAIASGKRWSEGVKAILEAYPDALSHKDVQTNLHPFLQAAVGPRADTGTILELLRKDPSVVRDAISVVPQDEPFHTAAKDQAHEASMDLGLEDEE